MTQLECSVKNCMHNSDHCCCKRSITVDGRTACKADETCCASFDENRGGSFKNLFKTPETRLEISCDAVKCIYNEDNRCKAQNVGIAGDGASNSDQTRCSTFKAR